VTASEISQPAAEACIRLLCSVGRLTSFAVKTSMASSYLHSIAWSICIQLAINAKVASNVHFPFSLNRWEPTPLYSNPKTEFREIIEFWNQAYGTRFCESTIKPKITQTFIQTNNTHRKLSSCFAEDQRLKFGFLVMVSWNNCDGWDCSCASATKKQWDFQSNWLN